MKQAAVVGVAALVAALSIEGPAEADLITLSQGSRIVAFSEPGTTTRKVATRFGFLWYPEVKRGAPGGYLLSFECNRAKEKGGKAVVSELNLTGVDTGESMSFDKKTGRFKKDSTGRITISNADLSSLADESAVMLTGRLRLSSDLEGVECFIFLTELLRGPP